MSRNIIIDGRVCEGVTALKAKNAEGDNYFSFDDTHDADAVASDIAAGKTAYVNGEKITGTNTGVEANDLDGLVDGTLVDFVIPSGKTNISQYRFYQFSALKTANLGAVKTVGARAFYECKAITTMALPASLNNIGEYAFYYAGSNGGSSFSLEPTDTCVVGTYAFRYARLSKVSGKFSTIGSYAFANSPVLVDIDVQACTSIGDYAFNTLSVAKNFYVKVNGTVGSYAFDNLMLLESVELDKDSVITSLGSYAFSRFGSNRPNPSENVIVLDLRNSTFTTVNTYAFGYSSSTASYKNKYMKIYLPDTVTTVSSYAFRYTDNCEIYFSSQKPPTLSATNIWQNATNYKIFVPFDAANEYRTATNFTAQASNIYGYAPENTLVQGDTLPTINTEGYGLTWYSDTGLTTPVSTVEDASVAYYCVVGTEKLAFKIAGITTIDCDIIVSDGTRTYASGDNVLKNTVLTITATATQDGYIPYMFTVNDEAFTSGNTFEMTEDISIVSIFYDGVNTPILPVFGDNNWALIREAFRTGVAASLWNIGDTKQVQLLDGNTYTVRIADMKAGRYNLADGTGTTNGVLEIVECLPTSYAINSSTKEGYYTGGGWSLCDMNQRMYNGEIYDLLPDEIKAVISEIKLNEYSYTSPTPREATSRLFLPAETEIFKDRHYSAEGTSTYPEYEQWGYYAQITTADGSSSTQRQKKKVNTTSTLFWWLRSPYSGSTSNFCGVYTNGTYSSTGAYSANGVSPCFAI